MTDKTDDVTARWQAIAAEHGADLLRLAASSIEAGLDSGRPVPVDPADWPEDLRGDGASFTTIEKNGDLRGCIGSPMAWRPLVIDIADNAFKAAFRDPRFNPVEAGELPALSLHISLLTPPEPLPVDDEADALAKIRPGVDGLIMMDLGQRGLFLPSVWESLPTAEQFLTHLKRKAGLPLDHWSDGLTLHRFTTISIKSDALPDPRSLWREA